MLQLSRTGSSAGMEPIFLPLFTNITKKWILVEPTGLNPSAKNIVHIVNMAIFNTASILK